MHTLPKTVQAVPLWAHPCCLMSVRKLLCALRFDWVPPAGVRAMARTAVAVPRPATQLRRLSQY